MHSTLSATVPGSFAATKTRVDAILRELADRHEGKAVAAPAGLAAIGGLLADWRTASVEAAVLRAAAERLH